MLRRSARRFSWIAFFVVPFAVTIGAGARADGPTYELKKNEPKVAVGAKSSASLTVTAKNGWHINGEAPITVLLTAPSGLTLGKTKLVREDLAESTQELARFEIPFEAVDVGTKVVLAEARFVMCQASACKPEKQTLSLNIEVTPPAAPASKAKPAGKKKHAT